MEHSHATRDTSFAKEWLLEEGVLEEGDERDTDGDADLATFHRLSIVDLSQQAQALSSVLLFRRIVDFLEGIHLTGSP